VKPAPLLLIALGTIFGPVYFAYCEYLSGETAETHTLTERADRWELPDGAILRFRGGLGYRPVALDLTPESNLYRLRFTFDAARIESSSKDAGNDYQVSVLEGDVGVFERSFRIVGNGSVALEPMEIPYGGSYVLLLEEAGTPQLHVAGVTLEVRSKVEKTQTWLVWSGLGMLAFAGVVVIRDLLMQSFGK